MRIAIVQFPGSNCERETKQAVSRAGMTPVDYLWNEPKEKLTSLDGYIIVGGFSYEDRSRAGIIAALNPIMPIIREQSETGKPVLGICNGAQILVEAGLVPGLEGNTVDVALTDNKRMKQGKILGTGYYNAWTYLKLANHSRANAFTRYLSPQSQLNIPIAHAEGRFLISPETLTQMHEEGLIVFQYCNQQSEIIDEFPVNPNGSMNNIAAISNQSGNIMAIMPHPERTPQGDAIFISMRDYIAEGYQPRQPTVSRSPVNLDIQPYPRSQTAHEMIVELIITDNQAFTVENTLKRLGLALTIKRQIHWEILCDSKSSLHQIQASGVLYNDRKEYLVTHQKTTGQRSFLVRAKEDWLGLQKMQQLKDHYDIHDIKTIRHGVLWHIQAEPEQLDPTVQQVIRSAILFNSLSHECYEYV